jgi:hypothetical protein
MGISFRGTIIKSMVPYLDDITIYSTKGEDHVPHLKAIFDWCRWYEISLNPKQSIFAIVEGTLLGFLISLDGITINPGKIESIKAIAPPHNKKAMQSFLGKINFVRRYFFDFAEIVKPL